MRVLITSGGTKIKIDSVRSITNMSNGTFGSQIAESFIRDNHVVDFLMAKGSKRPQGDENDHMISCFEYETFDEYEYLLEDRLRTFPDVVVLSAAVSDYGVVNAVNGKIRSHGDMTITLKPLPKLISRVKDISPNSILCGFKLLVNSTESELLDAAYSSIEKNGCDIVIANDLSTIKNTVDHSMFVVMNGWHRKFSRSKYILPDVVRTFCTSEWMKK